MARSEEHTSELQSHRFISYAEMEVAGRMAPVNTTGLFVFMEIGRAHV